ARPGFASQGGDYLPGTRASRLTLNHFLAFTQSNYTIVVSNRDAYAMQVGQSTDTTFDLPSWTVSVLATDTPLDAQVGIQDQGGDTSFTDRFALSGSASAFYAPDAMRLGLAHANPPHPVALARGQAGSWTSTTQSFLSVDLPNLVVTAFKPAEEAARGFVVRLWELSGHISMGNIDASALTPAEAYRTTLIETDR